MNVATIVILVLAAAGQQAEAQKNQTARAKSQQLLELHTSDAASFSIYRDAGRKQKLSLKSEPASTTRTSLMPRSSRWSRRPALILKSSCYLKPAGLLNLWVRLKVQEVVSAPFIPYNMPQQEPERRYHVFEDRKVPIQ